MSDLVGNREYRFSYNEAHIIIRWHAILYIVKRKHVFVLADLNSECSDTELGYLESSFSDTKIGQIRLSNKLETKGHIKLRTHSDWSAPLLVAYMHKPCFLIVWLK